MDVICAYSGKPMCERCKGPLYVCDPKKNESCRKIWCMTYNPATGVCRLTHNIQYAADQTPICSRQAVKKVVYP